MNNRRKLLYVLGACAVPVIAGAQHAKVGRIGVLNVARDAEAYDALRRGMSDLGYNEGKNIRYEPRDGEGKHERMQMLAAELVNQKVDVIVTIGSVATLAAQQATRTIPIVMTGVSDPIGSGFIASLSRPGANITGLTNVAAELGAKRLELLLAAMPKVSRAAILFNPDNVGRTLRQDLLAGSKKLDVRVLFFYAHDLEEIDRAFNAMARESAEALVVAADNVFTLHHQRIVAAAAKARLPTIYYHSRFVDAGGLMSYGINRQEQFRKAALHVHKILQGAKPSDLPVEQPTTFELVVNTKTAKSLGLAMPPEIMVRATRVIE